MSARHFLAIIIVLSSEHIMINKCASPLSIWLCQEQNKAYNKVSFFFEKLRTEPTVDWICQPQRLKTNKSLCFVCA